MAVLGPVRVFTSSENFPPSQAIKTALLHFCTSFWSIQPQRDGNAYSLPLKVTGHEGIPVFGREKGESRCMYVYVCMYAHLSSPLEAMGHWELLAQTEVAQVYAGICLDILFN